MRLCLLLIASALASALVPRAADAQPQPRTPSADPVVTEQFIYETFRDSLTTRMGAAIDGYLRVLGEAGNLSSEDQTQAVASRFVAQLAPMLPSVVRDEVFAEPPSPYTERFTLAPGAGEALLAWWRSQDPLPASAFNERLAEHLQRVAHATDAYAYARRPAGYDDRGRYWVQYGEPPRRVRISNDVLLNYESVVERRRHKANGEFTSLTTSNNRGLRVDPSEMIDAEAWVYPHLGDAGIFILAETDAQYHLVEFYELIPRRLRQFRNDELYGNMQLEVLKAYLEQLSAITPAYDSMLENIRIFEADLSKAASYSQSESSKALSETEKLVRPSPQDFAQHLFSRVTVEEKDRSYRRERLPQAATRVLDAIGDLPVAFRTARFLDPDGTTRADVYWAPYPGTIALDGPRRAALAEQGFTTTDQFHLRATGQTSDLAHNARATVTRNYALTDLSGEGATIPAQRLSLTPDTEHFHLALQWDQHLLDGKRSGPRLRVATARVDSLAALPADPSRLVLSDLLPVALIGGEVPFDEAGEPVLNPYPFGHITPEHDLGLYFEVYHLFVDGDGQSRYAVEYEVVKQQPSGLLRRTREERTSQKTTAVGQGRTARELIAIEWGALGGEGTLHLTIRVTDEATGQTAERHLRFELSEAAE